MPEEFNPRQEVVEFLEKMVSEKKGTHRIYICGELFTHERLLREIQAGSEIGMKYYFGVLEPAYDLVCEVGRNEDG